MAAPPALRGASNTPRAVFFLGGRVSEGASKVRFGETQGKHERSQEATGFGGGDLGMCV